jgi:hypothetical protein
MSYTTTQDKKSKAAPVYRFEDVDNEPVSNKIPNEKPRDADRELRRRILEARRVEKLKVKSQAAQKQEQAGVREVRPNPRASEDNWSEAVESFRR